MRNLLENHLDGSLLSRMAKDTSITERTTVQGSTGILSVLKGYFVEDPPRRQDNTRPRTTNRNTDDTEEGQYQPWKTAESSDPVHSAWIFQAYLRQVAAIAQRIELSISRWRKDRSESNSNRTTSELEELRTDMLGQLSNVGESWARLLMRTVCCA